MRLKPEDLSVLFSSFLVDSWPISLKNFQLLVSYDLNICSCSVWFMLAATKNKLYSITYSILNNVFFLCFYKFLDIIKPCFYCEHLFWNSIVTKVSALRNSIPFFISLTHLEISSQSAHYFIVKFLFLGPLILAIHEVAGSSPAGHASLATAADQPEYRCSTWSTDLRPGSTVYRNGCQPLLWR